jgi:hypothetical protein
VAEGLLFRNGITKMTNKLTSVVVECREISGEQDCLVNKVLLLQSNATELADKLERVARRPGWGA